MSDLKLGPLTLIPDGACGEFVDILVLEDDEQDLHNELTLRFSTWFLQQFATVLEALTTERDLAVAQAEVLRGEVARLAVELAERVRER